MLLNTTMTLSREDLKTIMLIVLNEMKRLDMQLKETKNRKRRDLINDTLADLSDIMLKLEKTMADINLEIAEMEEE